MHVSAVRSMDQNVETSVHQQVVESEKVLKTFAVELVNITLGNWVDHVKLYFALAQVAKSPHLFSSDQPLLLSFLYFGGVADAVYVAPAGIEVQSRSILNYSLILVSLVIWTQSESFLRNLFVSLQHFMFLHLINLLLRYRLKQGHDWSNPWSKATPTSVALFSFIP